MHHSTKSANSDFVAGHKASSRAISKIRFGYAVCKLSGTLDEILNDSPVSGVDPSAATPVAHEKQP